MRRRKLYGATPTQTHELAGRVVAMLRKGCLTDRPTLNNIHQIVERRANDPIWVKSFLRQLVDRATKADEPVNYCRDHVRQDLASQATPGFDYRGVLAEVVEDTGGYEVRQGEEIRSLTEYDASPATDLGETFRFAAYESDDAPMTEVADETWQGGWTTPPSTPRRPSLCRLSDGGG